MSAMGEIIGHYVGEIRREKLGPGCYRFHGPRGSVIYTKAREPVYVRSWARSGTRTLTVWNPSDCTAPESFWNERPRWTRTLAEAEDAAFGVLSEYRSRYS